jgi:exopolysaccharide production protein ExoZ
VLTPTDSPVASPHRRTLQTIQASRAVAALLVLLFHATLISQVYLNYDLLGGLFAFGYAGVDFFFVLSGFIIFWAHRKDIGRPERVVPYLKKRFIRIYPVYWIIALALVPIYYGAPQGFQDYVVLTRSFLLLPQPANPIVTAAWSLTHEVFFYAVFAIALYLPWRYVRPALVALISVTLFFYCAIVLSGGALGLPAHAALLLSPYNLEFAMGCLAGYLLGRSRLPDGRGLVFIGAIVFLLFGVAETVIHRHFGKTYSVVVFGLPSMLIVWGAVAWEKRTAPAIPSALLLMGDASYSIYLTHYALLDISVKRLLAWQVPALMGQPVSATLVIAFSTGAGVLFYWFIERPLLTALRKSQPGPPAST